MAQERGPLQFSINKELAETLRRVVLLVKERDRHASASSIAEQAIKVYLDSRYPDELSRVKHQMWYEKNR